VKTVYPPVSLRSNGGYNKKYCHNNDLTESWQIGLSTYSFIINPLNITTDDDLGLRLDVRDLTTYVGISNRRWGSGDPGIVPSLTPDTWYNIRPCRSRCECSVEIQLCSWSSTPISDCQTRRPFRTRPYLKGGIYGFNPLEILSWSWSTNVTDRLTDDMRSQDGALHCSTSRGNEYVMLCGSCERTTHVILMQRPVDSRLAPQQLCGLRWLNVMLDHSNYTLSTALIYPHQHLHIIVNMRCSCCSCSRHPDC